MESSFDALIVGAGPAGAFLAHKLARAGMSTLMIEKDESPRRKVCGEYLCPLGVDLLKREGLEQQIIENFLPLRGMLIVTAKGTEVPSEFPLQNKFRGVSVNRKSFDSNLVKLAQNSGAQFICGADVRKITKQKDQWLIETNKGSFTTRILVGADGRGSIVSKTFQNDIPNNQKRVALHVLVNSSTENLRRGEMHLFDDGAYIGINPTGEYEVNFSLVLDAAHLRKFEHTADALNYYLEKSKNLKSRFPKFLPADKISSAFPIQHSTKSIIPRANVALIGDAAGFVDPLTGEGMYNALLSASLLAESITAHYLTNQDIPKKAFTRYEKRYSKVLKQKIALNRGFQVLIKHPRVIQAIASFLLKKQKRADIFIGIIGNIYSPIIGLFKLILSIGSYS